MSACGGPALAPTTLAPQQAEQPVSKADSELARLSAVSKSSPNDTSAALAYAKALRAKGAKAEALAALEAPAKAKPGDRRLALERGLLTLELGDAARAEPLLKSALDPKSPDWRVHSALGTALASRGKHTEAREQFGKALALAPNHPSILNNLALSHALDGRAGDAETVLRKALPVAKTTPNAVKVQQNLSLALALGGKYREARTAAEGALPAARVGENVAYVQQLAEARTATPKSVRAD
jgi:Flp pilus assembly protein TadD